MGGTAVSGAWSSMASAGRGRRVDPGVSRVGPTSMIRAPHSAACATTSAVAARPGPRGARATTTVAGSDDGRGARGHLPGLRALGVHDGHLLELQGGFHGGDVGQTAPDDEHVLGVGELVGERIDQRSRCIDRRLGVVSRARDVRDRRVGAVATEQVEQQQLGRDQRGRERLGHDRDVARAAAREDDVGRDAGQRGSRHVDDPDDRHAVAPCLGNGDDVPELARRRDADDRVAVAERGRVRQERAGGHRDDDRVTGAWRDDRRAPPPRGSSDTRCRCR